MEQEPGQIPEGLGRVENEDMAREMAEAEKPKREAFITLKEMAGELGLSREAVEQAGIEFDLQSEARAEIIRQVYESAQEDADDFIVQSLKNGKAETINPYEEPDATDQNPEESKARFEAYLRIFPFVVISKLSVVNERGEVEMRKAFSLGSWERDAEGISAINLSYNPHS